MIRWEPWGRWGRVMQWAAVLAVVVAFLTYRCHAYFWNPDLRAEDGAQVFAFFFAHRDWHTLFRSKAGYLPLLPNLLGYLSARLPPPAAPYFLTLVPVLFTVAAFSAFNAAAFRRHVRSDLLRACCCMGLAIAPLGTNFLVCHTDYSIWNLFLLLLLLVMLPMPDRKWLGLAFVALLVVLIWSHPLSIAAAPATLYWLFRDRRWFSRGLNSLILSAHALHLRFGANPQSASAERRVRGLPKHVLALLQTWSHHVLDVLSRLSFPQAAAVSARLGQVCAIAFLVLLLGCAVLPKRAVASRACFAWILYCTTFPLLLVMFARPDWIVESSRYIYVARAFATLGACLVFWQFARWLASPLARFRVGQLFARRAPAIAVLSYCASLNQPGTNDRYGQLNPDNGRIIHACFAELGRLQDQHRSPCNLFVRCPKEHGDWAFAIDTRRACVD